MSDQSRVPKTIAEFNGYIIQTMQYISAGTPTNASRLGFTAPNVSDWNDYATDWVELYLLYNNPLTSTSVIKGNVRDLMHDFKAFAIPLLDIVAACPAATNDDAAVFNLVLNKDHKNPTHPTTPIMDTVMAEVKPTGDGVVQAVCRTHHDAKHASKHEGADSVQVAYKVDGTPPASINDNMHFELFTRAKFLIHLDMADSGKKVYFYMRWYNTKHPNLAGPWGQLITIYLT